MRSHEGGREGFDKDEGAFGGSGDQLNELVHVSGDVLVVGEGKLSSFGSTRDQSVVQNKGDATAQEVSGRRGGLG